MPATQAPATAGNTVRIHTAARFDFSQHRAFRDAYRTFTRSGLTFVVDLEATEYMDSAAFGMLLLLKEHADAHGSKVRLSRPRPEVSRLLAMAHFQSHFAIDS